MTYEEAVKGLRDTYVKKNAAYGDSAHRSYMKYGRISYHVRIGDKLNRMEQLTANDDLDTFGESLMDTIGDCATYLIMLAADMLCSAGAASDSGSTVDHMFTLAEMADPDWFALAYAKVGVRMTDEGIDNFADYLDWIDVTYGDDTAEEGKQYFDFALFMIAKYCMVARATEGKIE